MQLHVEQYGSGSRTAVLLHGMMGSSQSWWRLAPVLVANGYRALAVDLPGHGLSDRDHGLTVQRAADSVVEAVDSLIDGAPTVALGHSFGGLVLAAAAPALRPALTVYVDAPFSSRGGHDRMAVIEEYERDRLKRTAVALRETHPYYSEQDCVVEAVAAERFDPVTAAAVAAASGGSWMPVAGSIVVRPAQSNYVSEADVAVLKGRGVRIRSIPGAAHSVWYSHFDEFVGALPEVFDQRETPRG